MWTSIRLLSTSSMHLTDSVVKIMAKFSCTTTFIALIRRFNDGVLARSKLWRVLWTVSVDEWSRARCVLASTLFSMTFSAMRLSRLWWWYCNQIPLSWQAIQPKKVASQSQAGLGGSVGCVFDWRSGGCWFDPRRVGNILVEIDHEILSTVILSLTLIQEGQLSVSSERILVNRLED